MYCEKCGKYSGKYPLCKDCYYEDDDFDEIDEEDEDEDEEDLICPICGEPTNVYFGNPRNDRLCRKHGSLANKGEIVQCEDCGTWNNAREACHCKKPVPKKIVKEPPKETTISEPEETDNEIKKVIVINEENKSRCITCGKKTNGLLFCSSCYHKYNKKELLFKITECSSVELLDENYEGRFVCKDGHIVKSKSEREIDNYLFEKGISHAYEKSLPYGKTEKEVLHPDFFLPHYLGRDKHVWLEHWGYNDNNRDYTKTKKFKMDIYEKLGITLVCTYEETDTSDIDSALDRKLNKANITENEINHRDSNKLGTKKFNDEVPF